MSAPACNTCALLPLTCTSSASSSPPASSAVSSDASNIASIGIGARAASSEPPARLRSWLLTAKPSVASADMSAVAKLAIAALLATSAAAFAPAQSAGRTSTSLNLNGWIADEVR